MIKETGLMLKGKTGKVLESVYKCAFVWLNSVSNFGEYVQNRGRADKAGERLKFPTE